MPEYFNKFISPMFISMLLLIIFTSKIKKNILFITKQFTEYEVLNEKCKNMTSRITDTVGVIAFISFATQISIYTY